MPTNPKCFNFLTNLGFVFRSKAAAVLFGFMGGTCCNFATQLKFIFGYDDTLDIFASHAIGGIVGNLLTGLFAQASVAAFDGVTVIPGGWLDHHYKQLGIQLADSCSGFAWSLTVTVSHFLLRYSNFDNNPPFLKF